MDPGKYLNLNDPSLSFPKGASGAVVAKSCESIGTKTFSDVLGNTCNFSKMKHHDTSENVAVVSVDTKSAVCNCWCNLH